MISKFLFKFTNFCVTICFLTKLLTIGISFPTAVNAVFVAKLLTSRILFSDPVSCFLRKLVKLGIFFLVLLCLFDI